jgi:hypothetical protein
MLDSGVELRWALCSGKTLQVSLYCGRDLPDEKEPTREKWLWHRVGVERGPGRGKDPNKSILGALLQDPRRARICALSVWAGAKGQCRMDCRCGVTVRRGKRHKGYVHSCARHPQPVREEVGLPQLRCWDRRGSWDRASQRVTSGLLLPSDLPA